MKLKVDAEISQLLPPLSTAEQEVLKASIAAEGLREAIVVDEDGTILDGHHRFKACERVATAVTINGLSRPEKLALAIRRNVERRNLSPEEEKVLRKKQQHIAAQLREQDHKRFTQHAIAQLLGVTQRLVSYWLGSNRSASEASERDARCKVDPKERPAIAKRIAAGENREQVGADYGISGRQAATIATKEQKQIEAKKEREATVKKLGGKKLGVHHGDFREIGNQLVADDSVDLIFTDPPYDKKSVGLYGDLAKFAARVLRPSGLCLAYSGQSFLPEVLAAMSEHLVYAWTFAVEHGSALRFRKFKIQVNWKPIVGFYKKPLRPWWDWFTDFTRVGDREKDDHPWQQSEAEAEYFIAALCPMKGTVVDPFCGSGTSLLAAKSLGLKYAGFEIDEEHVVTSRQRLANDGQKKRRARRNAARELDT